MSTTAAIAAMSVANAHARARPAAVLVAVSDDELQRWCGLTELTQLLGIADTEIGAARVASFSRRRLAAGQALYRQGDGCATLYAVRLGTFKTVVVEAEGNEQVLGFWLRGDLLGSDGLVGGEYASTAVALEDSEVIAIHLAALARLGRAGERLERELYRLTSREVVQRSAALLTMGTLGAEARVARLLATLGERYGRMGYSSSQFNLRMSRQDMASHLGLTVETVSRSLSALAARGAIGVRHRAVQIRNPEALRRPLPAMSHRRCSS